MGFLTSVVVAVTKVFKISRDILVAGSNQALLVKLIWGAYSKGDRLQSRNRKGGVKMHRFLNKFLGGYLGDVVSDTLLLAVILIPVAFIKSLVDLFTQGTFHWYLGVLVQTLGGALVFFAIWLAIGRLVRGLRQR